MTSWRHRPGFMVPPWLRSGLLLLLLLPWRTCCLGSRHQDVLRTAESWISQDQGGKLTTKARELLMGVLEEQPMHAVANFLVGTSLHLQNELESALRHYDAAIASDPERAEAHANKGKALFDAGLAHEAVDSLLAALRLQPNHRLALLHLGTSLHATGRLEEAAQAFTRVIVDLGHAEDPAAHYGLGLALQHLGRIQDSAWHYQQALRNRPDHAEAALNLAALHHRYGSPEAALGHYRHALEVMERAGTAVVGDVVDLIIMTRNNMGLALTQLGDVSAAVREHEHVLRLLEGQGQSMGWQRLRSEAMQATSHIYRARRSVCDWVGWEATMGDLIRDMDARILTRGPIDTLLPFDTLSLPVPQPWRLAVARLFSSPFESLATTAAAHLPPLVTAPTSDGEEVEEGLRVGYLCYDFNEHPTAHLVEGLFAHHRSPAYALSYGKDDNSSYRRSIESLTGPRFIELAASGHREAATTARSLGLHIAVDLQGHTLGTRTEIAAQRVAPIQVSYLIYPGTSGASFIDFLIVDRHVTPPDYLTPTHYGHYAEKLVFMPHSYQVNYYHNPRLPPPPPPQHHEDDDEEERARLRAVHGLPPWPAVVLCNFNKVDKLEPSVFATWMAMLRRLPHSSVLWLLRPSSALAAPTIMANLGREAEALGVARSRLVFADRTSKAEHLSRQAAADLFLDTLYYGAHSTATDALRAGLPVLTTPGDAFPRRVGVSLLTTVGLPCLLMPSFKDYEDVAVWLGATEEGRQALSGARRRLRQAAAGEGEGRVLYDTEAWARSVERAYEALWDMHVMAGQQEEESGRDWRYHLMVLPPAAAAPV